MRRSAWTIVGALLLALWAWSQFAPSRTAVAPAAGTATETPAAAGALPAFLPAEARQTVQRVLDVGPHPYRQDGGVFQNRERLLPGRPVGYYREFTVTTPGSRDRGARRLVTGGDPPREFYYTDDHYRSFRRFDVPMGRMP
jgi:ribonuclease T1